MMVVVHNTATHFPSDSYTCVAPLVEFAEVLPSENIFTIFQSCTLLLLTAFYYIASPPREKNGRADTDDVREQRGVQQFLYI